METNLGDLGHDLRKYFTLTDIFLLVYYALLRCRRRRIYQPFLTLRASFLMLEINVFRCYEVKTEKSEKAGALPSPVKGSLLQPHTNTKGLVFQCSLISRTPSKENLVNIVHPHTMG